MNTLQRFGAGIVALAFAALSGCARIDYRMTADGQIYVIEANPNPNLAAEEDFAQSAKAAGVDYPELLEKLLALGSGYQAEWRAYYG